jgi:hypothetical protein
MKKTKLFASPTNVVYVDRDTNEKHDALLVSLSKDGIRVKTLMPNGDYTEEHEVLLEEILHSYHTER